MSLSASKRNVIGRRLHAFLQWMGGEFAFKLLNLVKTAIEEAGRINMLSWAEGRDSTPAESVNEIRELPLLGDCRTTACIGGLVCHLATSQEIASAAEIYDLSDEDLHEPYTLSAALLLKWAEDKYELESACFAALLFNALAT